MKKIAAASSLFLLALGSGLLGQTVPLMGPFDEALAKAKQENKPILVDFFSYG